MKKKCQIKITEFATINRIDAHSIQLFIIPHESIAFLSLIKAFYENQRTKKLMNWKWKNYYIFIWLNGQLTCFSIRVSIAFDCYFHCTRFTCYSFSIHLNESINECLKAKKQKRNIE